MGLVWVRLGDCCPGGICMEPATWLANAWPAWPRAAASGGSPREVPCPCGAPAVQEIRFC